MASLCPSIHSSFNLKSAFLGERSDILCTNSPVIKIGNRKPIQCKESRIGKRPIEVPSNVNITLEGQDLKVKGPLGELSWTYPREVKLELEESGILKVSKAMDTRRANQMHGLFRIDRREYIFLYERTIQCSLGDTTSKNETITKHLLSCFAASVMFISAPNQVIAAVTDNGILKFDDEKGSGMLMMRGMTANNFDPVRYSGRWFEVASLKRGFAGQGQEDCHCTQGIYTFDGATPAIQVDTFCIHGGPDGYITGIRGKVQCVSEEELGKTETDLERQEMIREKCYLRFPTLPFIPKEPYDVIATDYDNFALVSGAKDRSFVQIYSRTPTPGPPFIEKYKSYLANYGYDPSKIKDTPQDCEVMSNSQLALMMSKSGMQQALTNQFPDLELKSAVEFNPFTSVFETFKKLLALYFK